MVVHSFKLVRKSTDLIRGDDFVELLRLPIWQKFQHDIVSDKITSIYRLILEILGHVRYNQPENIYHLSVSQSVVIRGGTRYRQEGHLMKYRYSQWYTIVNKNVKFCIVHFKILR